MAKNLKYAQGNITGPLTKAIAQTASRTTNQPISGDPCMIGKIPAVALIDSDSDGRVTPQFDGIWEFLVAGVDSSGSADSDANVAVNGGDEIFFDKDNTPPLSKRATGDHFGWAMGDSGVQLVASGVLTTEINVKIGW